MIRTLLLTAAFLCIALGSGLWSAWHAVNNWAGVGDLRVGPWTAQPLLATDGADPYARAWMAREGTIPLGQTDGVVFHAAADTGGNTLARNCSYRIDGPMPVARVWTVHLTDADGRPLPQPAGFSSARHSHDVLRSRDGAVSIAVGPDARPGNWIHTDGSRERMRIALSLFDTSVADSSGLSELRLPSITRGACRA